MPNSRFCTSRFSPSLIHGLRRFLEGESAGFESVFRGPLRDPLKRGLISSANRGSRTRTFQFFQINYPKITLTLTPFNFFELDFRV